MTVMRIDPLLGETIDGQTVQSDTYFRVDFVTGESFNTVTELFPEDLLPYTFQTAESTISKDSLKDSLVLTFPYDFT